MANSIYVPTDGADSWRKLLGDPIKHWRNGYSAKACAYSWETARGLPQEINALLGGNAELLIAIPEHKVALPGLGGESQCDVFALVRRTDQVIALAVEAKVNEPFDKEIGEWLAAGGSNKSRRLTALCGILGALANPPGHLRYQLFHRTASAVLEARRFGADAAAMIVQSFSPDMRWKDDYDAFVDYLDCLPDGMGHQVVLPDGKKLFWGGRLARSQARQLNADRKNIRDARARIC